MTKSTRVLDRDIVTDEFVGFAGDYGDGSVFATYIEFDARDYAEFGSPESITITIEPGDRLNTEES